MATGQAFAPAAHMRNSASTPVRLGRAAMVLADSVRDRNHRDAQGARLTGVLPSLHRS